MSDTSSDVILGIDPGFDRCGWGVIAPDGPKWRVQDVGCIQTQKTQTSFERLRTIQQELNRVITQHHPAVAAIEEVFFSRNTASAMAVSQARGVIIGQLLQANISIFEYNPGTVKLAVTGHGRADKTAVTKLVSLQLGLNNPADLLDDAIDALAIALTHAVSHGILKL